MANSAVVGLLRVILTANTAEFSTAMKTVSSQAGAVSRDLKQIGTQAQNAGMALTKAFAPIAIALVGSAKAAIDFESSFAGVRKTVDATEAEFAQMAQSFRDLAKQIPINVNDLNRLGEAAGALGIPKKDIVEFSRVMAELGVTTNLTADEAADSVARIQNIFGAAGKDTERFASTLVALGNAGASTEKEIVTMAQRIAGAGHTVGLTQAQVLAFASTLASVGIEAEAGGSAISRVFLKMNDAVAKGGDGLKEFARVAGMSAQDFKKAFETDAAGAAQAFITGLGRLKAQGENINATMEGLIGKNIILKDTLLRVSGAGSLLADQLKLANKSWQDNTALTKEAEQRFKTTSSQLTLLWNRIKDIGITIGNALLPSINATIKALDFLLPIIDGLAKGFTALPTWMQATALGFLAIGAAAGPALILFGQIASGAGDLIAVFGKKGIATRALAADYGILTTSIRTLTATLLGPAGLIAALGGAAIAFTYWKTSQIKSTADAMYQASEIVKRAVTNIQEAKAILDAFAAGKEGRKLEGPVSLDLATAWQRGAEAAGKFQTATEGATITIAGFGTQATAAAASTGKTAAAMSHLAELNAAYAADLKKIGTSGFKEIQAAHDKFGQSVKDLATQYDVAESSITRFLGQQKATTKDFSEAVKLAEKYSGLALAKQVNDLAEAMRRLPPSSNFKLLAEDIGKLFHEGAKLTPEMIQLGIAFGTLTPKVIEGMDGIEGLGFKFHLALPDIKDVGDLLPPVKNGITGILSVLPKLDLSYQFKQAKPEISKVAKELSALTQALSQLGQLFDNAVGHALSSASGIISAFGGATRAAKDFAKALKDGTATAFQGVSAYLGLAAALGAYMQKAIAFLERDTLTASFVKNVTNAYGGVANLKKEAQAAGVSVERLFSTKSLTTFKRELAIVEAAIKRYRDISAQILAKQNEQAQTEQDILTKTTAVLEKYGLTWRDAGREFQDAHLDEGANELYQDMQLLQRAGVDNTVIFSKMHDRISLYLDEATKYASSVTDGFGKVIQQMILTGNVTDADYVKLRAYFDAAVKAGTEIPESWKPIIQTMIDLGYYTDVNQDGIIDLTDTGIIFSKTTTEGFQSVVDKLDEILQGLKALVEELHHVEVQAERTRGALEQIGTAVPRPLPGGDGSSTAVPVSTGGYVGARGVLRYALGGVVPEAQHFGGGGFVRFIPKGLDTQAAVLRVGEGVLNVENGMRILGRSGLAALNSGRLPSMAFADTAGRMPLQSVTVLELDKREFARAMADVLPGELRRLGVRVQAS